MPRGGKRPGAGAPRGNVNALTRGLHAHRPWLAYLVFHHYPPRAGRVLTRELIAAGVLPRHRPSTRRDMRRLLAYLINKWFDCLPANQSRTIKHNQTALLHRAAQVLREALEFERTLVQDAAAAPANAPSPSSRIPEKPRENQNP